jgi:alpha-galactosidase
MRWAVGHDRPWLEKFRPFPERARQRFHFRGVADSSDAPANNHFHPPKTLMTTPRFRKLLLTFSVLCCFAAKAAAAGGKPLKVFILAGQSNMEGHAEIRTFDYIGKDPRTAPLLGEMRNPDGKPKLCERVWMSYLTGPYDGSANGEGLGKLTTGFGARGDQPTKDGGKIGPEFTFGIYMEKGLPQPILLIKTAWGGRSLNTEFRPPSAGPYRLPKEIQEVWDKHPDGAHGVPKLAEREKWQAEKDAACGVFYRMMVEHVKKVLADPGRVCPEYDAKAGYELGGFVWLQGFNDLVDGQTYPNGNYDEYSRLLAHFIRDVRKDLAAPQLPFVIGVLGVGGESENAAFRKAMAAPASMPEFTGNVVAVPTAPFWDADIAAAEPKKGEYDRIVGTAHALKPDGTMDRDRKWDQYWKPIGKTPPEEQVWRFTAVNATEPKDKLEKYDARRFRDITLPASMENWQKPEFDDKSWTEGKAPIGKGLWDHSGVKLSQFPSKWGEGEFLLMRTTFEVEDLSYDSYRLAVLARQGFHVYLNGEKIHAYIWWLDGPQYRSIVLEPEQIRHLRKGKNVLAVYANDQYEPESPDRYGAIDVRIEGIRKADEKKLELALEEVLSPKDREALNGASNGGYHYFGSAKIFAQMGKAFADALLPLQK